MSSSQGSVRCCTLSTGVCVRVSLTHLYFQAEVFAELGDVVNGAKPALREKTTVFKSLGKSSETMGGCTALCSRWFSVAGMGVQDAASAQLVFEQWKTEAGQH